MVQASVFLSVTAQHFRIFVLYKPKHFRIFVLFPEKHLRKKENNITFAKHFHQIIKTIERIFKRKAYNRLLEWKQNRNGKTAILVEGARRVGKSTLVETFARNEYESYILIDFNKASKEVISLFDDLMDLDYVYENLVAQMLAAAGNKLFYYTWAKDSTHNYEIDFLLSRGAKLCPIEVKSSGYNAHASLDAFCDKYSSIIDRPYLIYTKDLKKDERTTLLPVYMTPFL